MSVRGADVPGRLPPEQGRPGLTLAVGMARGPGPDWPPAWQARRRYLPWRATPRPNGTTGKVPLSQHGYPTDPLDPRAWQSWAAAWGVVAAGQADGVGLALSPVLRLTVIDLDACLDGGRVTTQAQQVLDVFPAAYAEISPSGRGLHVAVRGACPAGWRRQAGVEVITHGFVTVTGAAFRPGHAADEQEALELWHARLAPGAARPDLRPPPPAAVSGDWFGRACQARNGTRFRALWDGEAGGCATPSEGDMILVLLLLYWIPGASDTELVQLLLSSGRARPKLADGRYLVRTLAAARRCRDRNATQCR